MIEIEKLYKNKIWDKLVNSNLIVFLILAFNLLYRLYIYFHTNLFNFSDFRIYLSAIEKINNIGRIPLNDGAYLFMNAYLGYFFKYVLNNMDYYFVFNCILGTISTLLIYYFLTNVFNDRGIGLIYLIMVSIYSEFVALSSIFYTQVIEIFFASIVILLIYKLHYAKSVLRSLLYIVIIIGLINISFFFKGTMRYLWLLFLIISIFNMRDYKLFIRYSLLAVLLMAVNFSLETFYPKIYSIINVQDPNTNTPGGIVFLFFGHTLYGGDGGEGNFIYPENKLKYELKYKKWMDENNFKISSNNTENQFRKEEIVSFITGHPIQWVKLQAYKFFRTFGIVPEGYTFTILYSGLFNYNWIFTALFLQLPFTLIIVLFVLCFDFRCLKDRLNNRFTWLWIGLFIYWLSATIFYGVFQERYRIPVMVIFIIPALSLFISGFTFRGFLENKISIMVKAISMILILGIWTSQAHYSLVVRSDRYFNFVNKVNNSNDPSSVIQEFYKNPDQQYPDNNNKD